MAKFDLSHHKSSYLDQQQQVEVQEFGPDIHEGPGMYLQFVDGCGYTVYTLSPDEAEALAKMLTTAAETTRKLFSSKEV